MTTSNGGSANGRQGGAPSGSGIFDSPAPAGHARKTSEVLGEIVWLMSQSHLHRQLFIADLEWLVMAPVLLGQFRIFYDQQKPVGVVFWGFVDAEVEARLAQGVTRLKPQDWKSGDRLWVVEVIAPFGPAGGGQASSAGGGQTNLADEMVQDLKLKVFAGRELKVLAVEGGQLKVRVV